MHGATLELVLALQGNPGYLREAVQSMLNQIHRDRTLLVVDDGKPSSAPRAATAGRLGDELGDLAPRGRPTRHVTAP